MELDLEDTTDPTLIILRNESYDDYMEGDVSIEAFASVVHFLSKYYIPMVVVLGILGNSLSLVVFLITYLNRLSLSVYLSALAVSDNGFLCALSIGWLEYAEFPLIHTNGWCQAVVYVSYVTSFLSVWFTVSFTVERYIAICHPLKRPEMCTTQRAKYVVSSLSALGLIGYGVSLWTSGVKETFPLEEIPMPVCEPFGDYFHINRLLIYVDTLVTLLIPFTVILILNIAITHRIAHFYGKKLQMSALQVRFVAGQRENRAKVCLGSRAQVKMTKMLLVISTVFLVVNSPSYIIRLRLFIANFTKVSGKTTHHDALVQQLSQFLFYLSFSINFFLYNICSKKFRGALCRMFWKMKYKFATFIQRSYRIIRGSSSPDTAYNDIAMRPVVIDPAAAYK